MGKLYIKAKEPCIRDDGMGTIVKMSHTEFYGNPRFKRIDPKTGKAVDAPRTANPNKIFEVPNSVYWTNNLLDRPDAINPTMRAVFTMASKSEENAFLAKKKPKGKAVKESEVEEINET